MGAADAITFGASRPRSGGTICSGAGTTSRTSLPPAPSFGSPYVDGESSSPSFQIGCSASIDRLYRRHTKDQLDIWPRGAHTGHMRTLTAGGGIAGLASAIAMRRVGHEVVVIEKASELREIGAALSLWPNSLAALAYLGLGQQIRSRSLEAPTASIRSSSGRPLVHFDSDAMRTALGGVPVVVLRADLQAVLLQACRDFGCRSASLYCSS